MLSGQMRSICLMSIICFATNRVPVDTMSPTSWTTTDRSEAVNRSIDIVDAPRIIDKNASWMFDGFPVFFECRLRAFTRTYTIRFARGNHAERLSVRHSASSGSAAQQPFASEQQQQQQPLSLALVHSYRSVGVSALASDEVPPTTSNRSSSSSSASTSQCSAEQPEYRATAVLYLRSDAYERLNKTHSTTSSRMRRLVTELLQRSTDPAHDLSDVYELALDIYITEKKSTAAEEKQTAGNERAFRSSCHLISLNALQSALQPEEAAAAAAETGQTKPTRRELEPPNGRRRTVASLTRLFVDDQPQQEAPQDRRRHRLSKRSSASAPPLALTVETCVHVDASVVAKAGAFLRTDDLEYVRIFLQVHFAQTNEQMDRVYASVRDAAYTLRVQLVDLVLHARPFAELAAFADQLNSRPVGNSIDLTSKRERYSSIVNQLFSVTHERRRAVAHCDHIFFVSDYRFDSNLGLAYAGQVCAPGLFVSHILFSIQMSQVMAHELGHNLGSEHDHLSCPGVRSLMFPSMMPEVSTLRLSSCSVQQIRDSLFMDDKDDKDDKDVKTKDNKTPRAARQLKANKRCLAQTTATPENNNNNNKNNNNVNSNNSDSSKQDIRRATQRLYEQLTAQKLPGHLYTMSDQCRLFSDNPTAYYSHRRPINCTYSYCSDRTSLTTDSRGSIVPADFAVVPLEGTWCKHEHVCLLFACVRVRVTDSTSRSAVAFADKSAQLLYTLCPYGAHEMSHRRLLSSDTATTTATEPADRVRSAGLATDCDAALSNVIQNDPCTFDSFRTACCEKCLALESARGRCTQRQLRKGDCSLPTCEQLGHLASPCRNGGTCVSEPPPHFNRTHLRVAFRCVCARGFRGELCLDYDPCALRPCPENELCMPVGQLAQYFCLCARDHPAYPRCSDAEPLRRGNASSAIGGFVHYSGGSDAAALNRSSRVRLSTSGPHIQLFSVERRKVVNCVLVGFLMVLTLLALANNVVGFVGPARSKQHAVSGY